MERMRDDRSRLHLPRQLLRRVDRQLAPDQSRAAFIERAVVERLARLAEFDA